MDSPRCPARSSAFGTIVALISALSTVVAIRQRYRRSTGTLREQMRLLVLVAATAGSVMLLGFVGTFVGALLGKDEETRHSSWHCSPSWS